jgi:hypothetical protein
MVSATNGSGATPPISTAAAIDTVKNRRCTIKGHGSWGPTHYRGTP